MPRSRSLTDRGLRLAASASSSWVSRGLGPQLPQQPGETQPRLLRHRPSIPLATVRRGRPAPRGTDPAPTVRGPGHPRHLSGVSRRGAMSCRDRRQTVTSHLPEPPSPARGLQPGSATGWPPPERAQRGRIVWAVVWAVMSWATPSPPPRVEPATPWPASRPRGGHHEPDPTPCAGLWPACHCGPAPWPPSPQRPPPGGPTRHSRPAGSSRQAGTTTCSCRQAGASTRRCHWGTSPARSIRSQPRSPPTPPSPAACPAGRSP